MSNLAVVYGQDLGSAQLQGRVTSEHSLFHLLQVCISLMPPGIRIAASNNGLSGPLPAALGATNSFLRLLVLNKNKLEGCLGRLTLGWKSRPISDTPHPRPPRIE